jgi:hypothetical protein
MGRLAHMKRLTLIELGALALAAILFVVGLASVIWPHSQVVLHFTHDARGSRPRNTVEFVTPAGAQVYGVLAMLLGLGLGTLAVYPRKR